MKWTAVCCFNHTLLNTAFDVGNCLSPVTFSCLVLEVVPLLLYSAA